MEKIRDEKAAVVTEAKERGGDVERRTEYEA